jgi:hypothetical protein
VRVDHTRFGGKPDSFGWTDGSDSPIGNEQSLVGRNRRVLYIDYGDVNDRKLWSNRRCVTARCQDEQWDARPRKLCRDHPVFSSADWQATGSV